MKLISNISVCLIVSLFHGHQGSVVTFTQDPAMVLTPLTREMTLTCQMKDTASSGSIVGRRDISQSIDNVKHVTSIVVTNGDGDHVASVTPFDPAKVIISDPSLSVKGDLSGSLGDRGYLNLTWQSPSFNQSGSYKCEVNAINELGHNVVYTSTVEVEVTTPTVLDLANYIHTVDQENQDLKTQLAALKLNISDQLPQQHIEHGRISCGGSGNWSHEGIYLHSHNVIQFSKMYAKSPIVHMSIIYWSHPAGHDFNYFFAALGHVDANGFDMICQIPEAGTVVNGAYVDWISFPE